MKQVIMSKLATKFEGVSEKILDKVADKLRKDVTTEEEATKIVEGYTLANLVEFYGDNRATDATKTAVLNYEKKHNLKEGKPVTEPTPEPAHSQADMPAWAKTLIEGQTALQQKIASIEGEKTKSERMNRVNEVISKLPDALRKPYERMDFSAMESEAFEDALSSIQQDTEEISKTLSASGATFSLPRQSNVNNTPTNGSASEKELEAAVSKLNL